MKSNCKFILNCTDGIERPFSFSVAKKEYINNSLWCNFCVKWTNHVGGNCPTKKSPESYEIKDNNGSIRDQDLEDYLNNNNQKYFCCACKTYIPKVRVQFLKTIDDKLEKDYNCLACAFKMDKSLNLGMKYQEALDIRKEEENKKQIIEWESNFHMAAGMD